MSIVNSVKKIIFYRMHPDTALRYTPIVNYLKQKKLIKSSILEIGSGSYGITPYLKLPIDGVDVMFDEGKFDLLHQIEGSALDLPFLDSQYDVVILSDVLEHIPKKYREKSLKESIRVAKKVVLISGPFGQLALAQDKKLADYSVKTLGNMHKFFAEHIKNGLPTIDDIDKYVGNNPKVEKTKVVGHFLNLRARELLMKIFITDSKLQYYFYLKGMMLLVPLFLHFNKSPCYRTFLEIIIKHE